mgnify:CR=1 FL=1
MGWYTMCNASPCSTWQIRSWTSCRLRWATRSRSIILPVPTARTKGVVLARTAFGNVLVGPTAEEVEERSHASVDETTLQSLIDKAVALIAYCGPPAKFFGNTAQLLRFQHDWLRSPTRAQAERWSDPDWNKRAQAMADDLGLYAMMAQRGFTRADLNKCLADEALVAELQKGTENAFYNEGVRGTPAFELNGELLPVNTWPALREVLAAALKGFV